MTNSTLTFLHTAPSNVVTFDRLLQEMAPDIPARHILNEKLLQDARAAGEITPALAQQISTAILEAGDDSAVVLCTCSTLGGSAEQVHHPTAGRVLRVDRAMAEKAASLGPRIVVVAALASTLEPTRRLILDVAQEMGKDVQFNEVICEGAWAKFEQGDNHGYHAAVAACVRRHAAHGDVVVLAQASMAGAADLCIDLPVPILSSPRLGLATAIDAYRTRSKGG
jgi:hypothetical protein